ncbi:hypothetical protein IHE45_05G126000 [Dioscorea alata]|uniref:Uncharacterized protein n=1 Tax=Dioscorea alata TaxID=55571 RepID=A0ACB7W522_DIOAL|nr:hypothetical protein IHE45_05G126000 [Dioscorea alata]
MRLELLVICLRSCSLSHHCQLFEEFVRTNQLSNFQGCLNSVGALFHLSYSTIFIVFSENSKRFKMVGLLLAVFCIFALIIYVSLEFFHGSERQNFVGYLSIASLISMCASPLFIINLVIRTKSVEFMPFYLSLATFLMSISFFTYGMLLHDFFIYLPNGVGAVLGVVQLLLYAYYSRRSSDISRLPLLVSN